MRAIEMRQYENEFTLEYGNYFEAFKTRREAIMKLVELNKNFNTPVRIFNRNGNVVKEADTIEVVDGKIKYWSCK